MARWRRLFGVLSVEGVWNGMLSKMEGFIQDMGYESTKAGTCDRASGGRAAIGRLATFGTVDQRIERWVVR